MSRSWNQPLRLIFAGSAVLLTMLLGAAPAGAAPGHTLQPNAVGCSVQVQNPHNSTHVPGTINVVGTVNCSGAVPHIALFVTLYRNGKYAGSDANDVYNTSSDSRNAAAPCTVLDTYDATAYAQVWFASGPQWSRVVHSPTYMWSKCDTGST